MRPRRFRELAAAYCHCQNNYTLMPCV